MKKTSMILVSLVLANGAAQAGEDNEGLKQAAMQVTQDFVQQLGGALKKEMATQGPVGAIGVCRDLAPTLSSRLSREKGWKVTRVGTRVRNPLLGTPDAWEQEVMAGFAARAADGEAYKSMAFSAVVEEPGGRYFRFMKAIGTQPVCLNCHGPADRIAPEVKAVLAEQYPMDQALGYAVGDLRGAVSIKQPMP